MANAPKEKAPVIMLPEGRLVFHSLFERDIYKDPDTGAEGKPKYQIVMAFDPSAVTGEGTIEDHMADIIAAEYGDTVANEWLETPRRADRITPFKSGDVLCADKEAKGKKGDAYKGKLVLTATTTFNRSGDQGPGGTNVYAPDTSPVGIVEGNKDTVYWGCYGIAAVTFKAYKDYPRKGDRALTAYLTGFQKTRDGEPLKEQGGTGGQNAAAMGFKPVAGSAPANDAAGGRRRRAG